MPVFDGPLDDETRASRLTSQHNEVFGLMSDGEWRTLGEIEEATGYPQASISAQLRHLRKHRFGSWNVEKRHIDHGLWQYRVSRPFSLEG